VVELSRDPVAKALAVMRWLVDEGPRVCGTRQVAAVLSVSPSSAHRILHGLAAAGLLEAKHDGFCLSAEFYRLAAKATSRSPIQQIAVPILEAVVAECDETAALCLYSRRRRAVTFAALCESSQPLRHVIEPHTWSPLHAGASGLAILACLDDDEVRAIARATGLPALTEDTITDVEELLCELAPIRKRGYAISRGQRVPGAVGIAAPVFAADGEVVGDLVVTIPRSRYRESRRKQLADLVRRFAALGTQQLGGTLAGRPAGTRSSADAATR